MSRSTTHSDATPWQKFRAKLPNIHPVYFVLAALIVAIILNNPRWARPTGYMNFLKAAAPLAILAIGQLYVIVSGGFDLSVGSLVTLVVVGSAMLSNNDPSTTWWVILVMFAIGLSVGTLNGLIVCYLKVPSLITTLGMMITLTGVTMMWSGGAPRGYLSENFRYFGRAIIRDIPVVRFIPVALIVLIVVGFILWWLMHRTNYGKLLHAVGDNPQAARLAGVPINRVRIIAFIVSALSAVVTGILLGGFAGVSIDVGSGYELQAITAAVLGGAMLLGGRGSVLATIAGALTLIAIFTLLNFMGLPQPVRQVVQGLVLITAVAIAMRNKNTGN